MKTFADKVLEFNEWLANVSLDLPEGYAVRNPFRGENQDQIKEVTKLFYQKYYADSKRRFLILGSSPARGGTAVTGIPFEDAAHLYQETGIQIEHFHVNKSSSDFLYEVMEGYGGCAKFYEDFVLSFVCPLGITHINTKGNEVNANYYESKKLEKALFDFIVESLQRQLSFGIDPSVCFCIGSGENFNFLTRINEQYHFFDQIVALEHPRYITQYHGKDKDKYLKKYIEFLNSIN